MPVELNAWYKLSGLIKTQDLKGATGALLNIQNMQHVRTDAVCGTQEWTRVSTVFRATEEELEINCLFGGWGESSGRAWYDEIVLAPAAFEEASEVHVELSSAMAGAPVSPQLFGHNLEHTRRAIWTGLSAEMVANRKFAAVDSGLAKHWWTLSGSGVSVDNQVSYAGEHSLRLEQSGTTDCGIWQQHDWLAFREGDQYAFRVWARAEREQTLLMRVVTRSGFTYVFSGETVVAPGEWRLWSGEFTAPCSAKGARLEIALSAPGRVWLGAVSLMPADNFHGMRRDVVELLKQLKPGNLRWPGGCFAEYYDWREGLLPVDQRPPIGPHQWVGLLPDSDGYDNHEMGIDEFIALCREVNAAPAITTRFSEGSPEEAAAWVAYCNGSADAGWGKRRAERGHVEPYEVAYWYVGNELTGMSLLEGEARTNPELLAARCREHIVAMKEADPTITLNVGVPSAAQWLAPLFSKTAGAVDEVQTGFYFAPDRNITMEDCLYAPVHDVLPTLQGLRRSIESIAPAEKDLGISYYEWNVMWDRSGDARSGVFAGGMLNMLCREAAALGAVRASYFQPVTEGAIRVGPRDSTLEPDGQVFALYAAHQGNQLLEPAFDSSGAIDLCASLAPQGGEIFATVINRNETTPCKLRISLVDFPALRSASAEFLTPGTGGECEGFAHTEEALQTVVGREIVAELPPRSIAGLRLNMQEGNKEQK